MWNNIMLVEEFILKKNEDQSLYSIIDFIGKLFQRKSDINLKEKGYVVDNDISLIYFKY